MTAEEIDAYLKALKDISREQRKLEQQNRRGARRPARRPARRR